MQQRKVRPVTIEAQIGRDEILARATSLVPELRARSEQAEILRRCPDETIAQYQELGLLKICQPKRYGGYELGWDVLCEVSQTLARACGSQAWVQNVYTDHAQKLGTFSPEAQHDVWGENPNARISASFDPVGKAHRVDGGVIVSGRHGFSSGVDHAQWVIAGGHIYDGDQRANQCFFLLPTTDITIIDDWHVIGFAGTGSKSFEVRDVFVPQHRILDAKESALGHGQGGNPAAIFRLPRNGSVTSTGFAAVAVGIAEGFLANYIEYTRPRKSRGTAVADLMGTQMSVGAASAQICAAATVYLEAARRAMRALERGEEITAEQMVAAKRDSAFATQLSFEAVMRLFNAAGGRALSETGVLQRQFRDIVAAASHYALVWDTVSAEYGRFAFQSV
jgi:3-hydroxy-9,10-secoandrosta-1,3,5(10)-triene-9,17-dione monooxygenase